MFRSKKSGGRRIGIGGIGPEQVPKQQRPVDEGVVKIFIVVDVDVDVDDSTLHFPTICVRRNKPPED